MLRSCLIRAASRRSPVPPGLETRPNVFSKGLVLSGRRKAALTLAAEMKSVPYQSFCALVYLIYPATLSSAASCLP